MPATSSSRNEDHARILQLERPAGRRAAGAQRQQQPAERDADEDHAAGIGQRLAARGRFALARAGEAQRLEAEDREDARHDVEQQPAEQRAAERGEQGDAAAGRGGVAGRVGDRRAGGGHRAGHARRATGRHPCRCAARPRSAAGAAAPATALVSIDQRVAVARHALRRGIIDRAIGQREEIGVADRHRGGQRHAEPEGAARRWRSGPRRRAGGAAPCGSRRTRAVAVGVPSPTVRSSAISACSGTQISSVQASHLAVPRIGSLRAGREAGGHVERDQVGVIGLIDIVHQPGDQQRMRHRILQRPGGDAGGQLPVDRRLDPGVAGILPIAVPALLGLHRQRDRRRPSGSRLGALGDEARADMRGALRQRRGRRGGRRAGAAGG